MDAAGGVVVAAGGAREPVYVLLVPELLEMFLGASARLLPSVDVLRVEACSGETCSLRFAASTLKIPWSNPCRSLVVVLLRQAFNVGTVDSLREQMLLPFRGAVGRCIH